MKKQKRTNFGRVPVLGKEEHGEERVSFEIDQEVLKGHKSYICCLLIFDSPQNKIISGSRDGTIKIWCKNSNKCLKTITDDFSNEYLNAMNKMGENTFLCFSNNGTARSYSLCNYEKIKEFRTNGSVFFSLRLNDDLLACRCENSTIVIMSYSLERIIKKFHIGYLDPDNYPLVMSKKYPDSFYVPIQDEKESIKLLDHRNNLVVKEFQLHIPLIEECKLVASVAVFTTKNDEEFLLVCDTTQNILFYQTSHPQFTKNQKLRVYKNDENVIFPSLEKNYPSDAPENKIICSSFVGENYFCFGDSRSSLHFCQVLEGDDFCPLKLRKFSKEVHESIVNVIRCLVNKNNPSELIIFSCSGDQTVKRSRVSPIRNMSPFEVLDRSERRVHFLKCTGLKVTINLLRNYSVLFAPKILF